MEEIENIVPIPLLFVFVILAIIIRIYKYKSKPDVDEHKVLEAAQNIYRPEYDYYCGKGEMWSKAALEEIAKSRIPIPNYPINPDKYMHWMLFRFLHYDVLMELDIIKHNLIIIEKLTNDEAKLLYVQCRGKLKLLERLIYRWGYNYSDKYGNGKFWSSNDLREIAMQRIRIPSYGFFDTARYPHWMLFHFLHYDAPMELEIIEHNLTIIERLTNDEAKSLCSQ